MQHLIVGVATGHVIAVIAKTIQQTNATSLNVHLTHMNHTVIATVILAIKRITRQINARRLNVLKIPTNRTDIVTVIMGIRKIIVLANVSQFIRLLRLPHRHSILLWRHQHQHQRQHQHQHQH